MYKKDYKFLSIQIVTLLTSTYLLTINFKQCCRLKFVNNIVQTLATWQGQYKLSGCRNICCLKSFFFKNPKFVAKSP